MGEKKLHGRIELRDIYHGIKIHISPTYALVSTQLIC